MARCWCYDDDDDERSVVAILKHGGTEKNDLQYMPYYCRLLMTCSVGL